MAYHWFSSFFSVSQVYLKAPMILNGVCVIWKGWIDLQRLDGMGCLEFDEERAQVGRPQALLTLVPLFTPNLAFV